MNLRDLRYLLSVAKHRHFGKAAEECCVSQPALSMQLKKLEEELGVKLFERTNKNVMITSVGELILKRALSVLREVDEIIDIAKAFQEPFAGKLRIGAFPTLAPYFFPKLVASIVSSLPDIRLFLLEEKTDILIDKLRNGDIDAAFLAIPLPVDDGIFDYIPLFHDEFLLAVSCNHKFAAYDEISLDALRGEELLLLEEGHCLRHQALDICRMVGMGENRDFRATSLETLRAMVAGNSGITLIPSLARRTGDGISYLNFKGENPSRHIALVYRKTTARRELFREISELSLSVYSSLVSG